MDEYVYQPDFAAFPNEELLECSKDRDRLDVIQDWLGKPMKVETLDFVLAPVTDSPNQHFVEVENMDRAGVKLGEYVTRSDGFHAIRFRAVVENDDE